MLRKNYFTFLLTAVLCITSGITVFAQTAATRGKVELKKADGSTVPVEGAVIDIYRTDMKGKPPSATTNKKGEFNFAGLQVDGTFMLVISAPNANPQIAPGIKAGMTDVVITLVEGDGRTLTEEEAREALTGSPTNQSGDQKKAKEEYEKKVAEVTSKNAKTKETDDLVKKIFEEGSKAFENKNYDLAIAKFEEGYKTNPEFIGSAPVLLSNKGLALRLRGSVLYNESVKLSDMTIRLENMKKVTQDFADAVDAYSLSWNVLKNAPAAEITDRKNYDTNKSQTLRGARDLVKALVVTEKIDNSKLDAIKALMQEYIAFETDKTAKTEAQVALGDIYRITGNSDNAITEYRKALEMSADNPDALAGLGLSLFNSGEISGNTQQKQEGLNYMTRFAEVAPDTHKLKLSVAEAVKYLKAQNLTPQKVNKKKN